MNQVNTFVFDVDGVLTDGTIHISSQGELTRKMNAKDGYALKSAVDAGYRVCIISGGSNPGVSMRLEGLGIEDIFLGVQDKITAFRTYIDRHKIAPEQIVYMGDDIPDFQVMQQVGLPSCPKDAVPEIQQVAKYISQIKGGKGCVRDVIEQVMKVQGQWQLPDNTSHN